jgi:Ion channel
VCLVTLLPADLVFFRFMTLTRVGYGDIIPISAEARLVAVFEAVAGVFFLAFLVARLVALSCAEEDYRHPARTRAGIPQVPNIPQERRRRVSGRTR